MFILFVVVVCVIFGPYVYWSIDPLALADPEGELGGGGGISGGSRGGLGGLNPPPWAAK